MSDESTPQAPPPSEMELLRAEMRAGFQSIGMRLDRHDTRFGSLETRSVSLGTRFGSLETRSVSLETRFGSLETRFGSLETRFGSLETRFGSLETRSGSLETRSVSLETRFGSLETRIDTAAEDTRRHMDVRVEGLRLDFQVVIDKTVATGKKVDRLIASNAIEHAAFQEFVTDHEVRIAQLEASSDPAPSPEDR